MGAIIVSTTIVGTTLAASASVSISQILAADTIDAHTLIPLGLTVSAMLLFLAVAWRVSCYVANLEAWRREIEKRLNEKHDSNKR